MRRHHQYLRKYLSSLLFTITAIFFYGSTAIAIEYTDFTEIFAESGESLESNFRGLLTHATPIEIEALTTGLGFFFPEKTEETETTDGEIPPAPPPPPIGTVVKYIDTVHNITPISSTEQKTHRPVKGRKVAIIDTRNNADLFNAELAKKLARRSQINSTLVELASTVSQQVPDRTTPEKTATIPTPALLKPAIKSKPAIKFKPEKQSGPSLGSDSDSGPKSRSRPVPKPRTKPGSKTPHSAAGQTISTPSLAEAAPHNSSQTEHTTIKQEWHDDRMSLAALAKRWEEGKGIPDKVGHTEMVGILNSMFSILEGIYNRMAEQS